MQISPNRVAALAAALTAAVSALGAVLGLVPDSWKGPVLIALIVCVTVLAAVFMVGSWRRHPETGPLS